MEYRTMNRKEIASELSISITTLTRRMEEVLKPKFLKRIKGRSILFENEVKHIYESITGMNNKW
jgi:DNA-binding Lrp family transcriptional regulator